MNSQNKNYTCTHCGTENLSDSEAPPNGMEKKEQFLCLICKKPLFDSQASSYLDSENETDRNSGLSFFIFFFLLSGLMIYLNRTFDVLTLKNDSGQIVYEILIIFIVSSSLASGKIRQNLKNLAIWAVIFLLLMAGYSYRHEISGIKEKIVAEIIPSKGIQNTPNSVSFPMAADGHFYIRAEVNGIPITFLADTGASHIVLSPIDAEKLGIKTDELRFDRYYETANGNVRGSSIQITDFRVGAINMKKIGASVNEAEMRDSLLGMTFFRRLKSYEVKNDVLTIYWSE